MHYFSSQNESTIFLKKHIKKFLFWAVVQFVGAQTAR